jgi:hypothetical protein
MPMLKASKINLVFKKSFSAGQRFFVVDVANLFPKTILL